MDRLDRRSFLGKASLAASLPLVLSPAPSPAADVAGIVAAGPAADPPTDPLRPRVRWLEGTPRHHGGCSFGVPWPRGALAPGTPLRLVAEDGGAVPAQSRVLATWPDGSAKWTGHAVPAGAGLSSPALRVEPGEPAAPAMPVTVAESAEGWVVDNGLLRVVVPVSGDALVASIARGGRVGAASLRLVGSVQDQPEADGPGAPRPFVGETASVVVEQAGPVRAVLLVTGFHRLDEGRRWLPFRVRLRLDAGSDVVNLTHSFVFDGDPARDFLRGLGVAVDVPLVDALHDRHVRFAGENGGVWGEAVRPITGLRRDAGREAREAQVAGLPTGDPATWDPRVGNRLARIPAWGDFQLGQPNANGFAIRKRTAPGHGWVPADQGRRAPGLACVGGISGAVALGMRDFWRLHPTALEIRGAASATATLTAWIHAPVAPPLDLRFYHDGLGLDTHDAQLDALEVTYEDYEPGFGTAHGVARSSDLRLHVLAATPPREDFAAMAGSIDVPPQLVATPATLHAAGAFGPLWKPRVATPAPAEAALEARLDWQVAFYRGQVEQRHWYGFWDHGDVMHTYDADRHVWRYDIGGYAWANSELSPDLWLWMAFLRTGDAATYRLAEAMTRHNRDVDIYHLGPFAGLGTRHNVQHWGCSAKQLRISTAAYRRFHAYLAADERTGDVLDLVVDADRRLAEVVPGRKLPANRGNPPGTRIGVGTDWGSAAANWLAAWERTGDPVHGRRLEAAMRAIGSHPLGFFAGAFAFDPDTKELGHLAVERPSVSHLSAVFGLPEVIAELVGLVHVPEFEEAWLRYCRLYNAPADEQREALGAPLRGTNLRVAHARLTAWAAARSNGADPDPLLAARAWREFLAPEGGQPTPLATRRVEGPAVLNPVDEAAWVSTNDASQWGLAAIQLLALLGPPPAP